MTDDQALRLERIADSPGALAERAEALMAELGRDVPFDASWIALADPLATGYTALASTALDERTLQYLAGPEMAHDIEVTGTDRERPPLSPSDLPYPAQELPTWAECLLPAGFHEALAVALFDPGGRHVGFVALLSGSAQPPPDAVRQRLAALVPALADGIDPMRSLPAAARLVHGAGAGAVLFRSGAVARLPGLPDDDLLAPGSEVLSIAREMITGGQVYGSFLWPRGGRHAPDDHVRVTALTGTDDVGFLLTGIVLLSPAGPLHGLTPRELEVLGLVVDGCSNQEIARALVVAPRTVAAHLEHILVKLQASSRTLAAVRAEREGLYVPARPPRARPSGVRQDLGITAGAAAGPAVGAPF
jgi:DNA-binding CsgD family transcriptional regulator